MVIIKSSLQMFRLPRRARSFAVLHTISTCFKVTCVDKISRKNEISLHRSYLRNWVWCRFNAALSIIYVFQLTVNAHVIVPHPILDLSTVQMEKHSITVFQVFSPFAFVSITVSTYKQPYIISVYVYSLHRRPYFTQSFFEVISEFPIKKRTIRTPLLSMTVSFSISKIPDVKRTVWINPQAITVHFPILPVAPVAKFENVGVGDSLCQHTKSVPVIIKQISLVQFVVPGQYNTFSCRIKSYLRIIPNIY